MNEYEGVSMSMYMYIGKYTCISNEANQPTPKVCLNAGQAPINSKYHCRSSSIRDILYRRLLSSELNDLKYVDFIICDFTWRTVLEDAIIGNKGFVCQDEDLISEENELTIQVDSDNIIQWGCARKLCIQYTTSEYIDMRSESATWLIWHAI